MTEAIVSLASSFYLSGTFNHMRYFYIHIYIYAMVFGLLPDRAWATLVE